MQTIQTMKQYPAHSKLHLIAWALISVLTILFPVIIISTGRASYVCGPQPILWAREAGGGLNSLGVVQ